MLNAIRQLDKFTEWHYGGYIINAIYGTKFCNNLGGYLRYSYIVGNIQLPCPQVLKSFGDGCKVLSINI